MTLNLPRVRFLGMDLSVVDRQELIEAIDALARAPGVSLVNNVNVHACNIAWSDSAFRKVLNRSELVFCDGFGVKLGAWMRGLRLGPRMTPPDWIDDLFRLCVQRGYAIYLLGDREEVVKTFAEQAVRNHPALRIAGWHHGYFSLQGPEADAVYSAVRRARPDVVITGMGMPRQEMWAEGARARLDRGVLIAAGALFRWYTGLDKRAPRWVTDHGLEWLSRFVGHPVRHFRRYAVGLPLFFFRVIFSRRDAENTRPKAE